MRFNASAIAMLPSVVAGTLLKAPLKLPIGVRTALTMTLCCVFIFSPDVLTFCSLQLSLRWKYRPQRSPLVACPLRQMQEPIYQLPCCFILLVIEDS